MNSMLFVNALVRYKKLYIKPYYVRKPSMAKLTQLLNTDNIGEMQKFAIFIKNVFNIYKDVIFN